MISMTLPQYRRRECAVDGRCVRLKPAEAETLALLLVNGPDRFLSGDELIEALWPNPDFEPNWALAIVWRRIHELRAYGVPIENCYKRGWRIPRHARAAGPERLAA